MGEGERRQRDLALLATRYSLRIEIAAEELRGIADTLSAPGSTSKGSAYAIRRVAKKLEDTLKR